MSQLNQLQFSFDAREDRILLRMNTKEGAEFRFWLTRRYVRLLWPALSNLLLENPLVQRQTDAQSKLTVLSFQHEQAVSNANFTSPFEEDAGTFPLGDAPVLLSRVQVRRANSGGRILGLHAEDGKGIDVNVGPHILHALCQLLGEVVGKTDWGLELLRKPRVPEPVAGKHVTLN